MKVFDLICGDGHRFEGWFASAERFAAQCDAFEVSCPMCDSADIRREPSATRFNLGTEAPAARRQSAEVPDSAVFRRLRELVAGTEDVGPRFAEEARRIHYQETPARAIRGTATDRERRDLQDEGIETLSVPIPRALTETMQ